MKVNRCGSVTWEVRLTRLGGKNRRAKEYD